MKKVSVFGRMYSRWLLTVPKHDIYECDLDGRKCGKGQEREGGREGGYKDVACTDTHTGKKQIISIR